ncbi:hypothetical protein STCU_04305 [Strigomonas culicis]|nr:hypothetical protein STCU_04305 [Strigomonas culicis]|eukprot:EPY29961.1 hypothetical protein STCU_04305 [Strigomonas culicis]
MVITPFRMMNNRLHAEAPWLVSLGMLMVASAIPLLAYPYVKEYMSQGKRQRLEEERVRLCLQKGVDPFPLMRHKDLVFGHQTIGQKTESQYPTAASWEYQSVLNFHREKEKLREEVGGDVEDSVQKLLALRAKCDEKARKSIVEPPGLVFRGRDDTDQVRS